MIEKLCQKPKTKEKVMVYPRNIKDRYPRNIKDSSAQFLW